MEDSQGQHEQQQPEAVAEELAFSELKLGDAWGASVTKSRAHELEVALKQSEVAISNDEDASPFEGMRLTGADVFWLVVSTLVGTTPQLDANVAEWLLQVRDDFLARRHISLSALNLNGADLSGAKLSGAILRYVDLSDANFNKANLSNADLEGADLSGAHLYEADLSHAELSDTVLTEASLWHANLSGADLSEADLSQASLRFANLSGASLFRSNLLEADLLRANLSGVDLQGARMNVETDLTEAVLSPTTQLADVIWNGAPLARISWETLPVVGDETVARQPQDSDGEVKDAEERRGDFAGAARAYRLLAVALRSQGLNEHADRYAYRAQLMQRVVLRRQVFLPEKGKRVELRRRFRSFAGYVGSLLLDLISGYGFRPLRAFAAYALVIVLFTGLYLLNSHFVAPHLTWNEALVLSMSSFHGRGFFNSNIQLGDTYAQLAALEALVGLFIEVTFIATFTQRFFAR